MGMIERCRFGPLVFILVPGTGIVDADDWVVTSRDSIESPARTAESDDHGIDLRANRGPAPEKVSPCKESAVMKMLGLRDSVHVGPASVGARRIRCVGVITLLTAGDEGGPWYYEVAAWNSLCGAEGPY